jgi:hypothetical protein
LYRTIYGRDKIKVYSKDNKTFEIIIIKLKIREMHATILYDNSSSLKTSVYIRQELQRIVPFLNASNVLCIRCRISLILSTQN